MEVEADLTSTQDAMAESQSAERQARAEAREKAMEVEIKIEAVDRLERRLASVEAQLVTSQYVNYHVDSCVISISLTVCCLVARVASDEVQQRQKSALETAEAAFKESEEKMVRNSKTL